MTLCLVTGAGGFTGGYLVEELLKRGYHVRAMVRRRSDDYIAPKLLRLQKEYPLLNIIKGDVTDFHDICESMFRVDQVYHLASQSFVPDSVANPSYSFQTNVFGTSNVLEAARRMKSYHGTEPRILFASSSEVYGKQSEKELPLNEKSAVRPASPYATSKLFGENLCRNYFDNYGLKTVVTRAFNHEGVGRGHHFVTASICRQLVMIKNGERQYMTLGDTSPTRDWSLVHDIVDGYILALEKGDLGETYVLGSGKAMSIYQFALLGADVLDIPKLEFDLDANLVRPNDVPRLRADPTKIKKKGWKPKYSLTDIMVLMLDYYEKMTSQERADIEMRIK